MEACLKRDPSAAILHGVIASIAPDARIIDISHEVRKFAVRDGALLLWCAQNPWLSEHVPSWGFVRRAVKRFMPGEEFDSALKAAVLPSTRLPSELASPIPSAWLNSATFFRTVLLLESWAVNVTLNAVPATCGLLTVETAKWWSGPIIVIVYAALAAQIRPGFAPSRVKLKVPAVVGVPLRLLP